MFDEHNDMFDGDTSRSMRDESECDNKNELDFVVEDTVMAKRYAGSNVTNMDAGCRPQLEVLPSWDMRFFGKLGFSRNSVISAAWHPSPDLRMSNYDKEIKNNPERF